MKKPMDWLVYSVIVSGITIVAFFLAAQGTILSGLGWLIFLGVFLYMILHNPATFFRRGLMTIVGLGLTNVLIIKLVIDLLNLTPQNISEALQSILDIFSPFSESPLFVYVFGFFAFASLIEMVINHDEFTDKLFKNQLPLTCSATKTDSWQLEKVIDNNGKEYFRVGAYLEIANLEGYECALNHSNTSLSFFFMHVWSWKVKQPQCFDIKTNQVYDPGTVVPSGKTIYVHQFFKFNSLLVTVLFKLKFIKFLGVTLCFNEGISQLYQVSGQLEVIR